MTIVFAWERTWEVKAVDAGVTAPRKCLCTPHACGHVRVDVCIDMRTGMCIGVRIHTCVKFVKTSVCAGRSGDSRTNMSEELICYKN